MKTEEIARYTETEVKSIQACLRGAEMVLKAIPNACGNNPMAIDPVFSNSTCKIYLRTGEWVGPHEARFERLPE